MESGEEQPTLSLKALTRSGYPPPPPGNFPKPCQARAGPRHAGPAYSATRLRPAEAQAARLRAAP